MTKLVRTGLLFLFLLTFLSLPLFGGVNRWTTRGPEIAGRITAIAVSPLDDAVVYAAGATGGVFRSDDAGRHWRRRSAGLADWAMEGLTIALDAPLTLYALTQSGRLFKTEDGAESWREVTTPSAGRKIAVIALDGGVVLVSTESGLIFRSADGGATWASLVSPCGVARWFKRSPDGAVACTGAYGALSADRGATFRRVETLPRLSLIAFAGDGSIFGVSTEGTHKSVDGAKSWQKVAENAPSVARMNDLFVSRSGLLFAASDKGVFARRDGAWKPLVMEGFVSSVAAGSAASERLYAAAWNGVLTGLETDASWERANEGLANLHTPGIAISPYDPSLLFAAGGSSLFRSDDAAGTWETLGAGFWGWVATTPASPNVLYGSTASAIVKSTDVGETWTAIKPSTATNLAVAPSDPSRLYAALVSEGMARSADGGASWTPIMNNMPFGYYAAWYGFDAAITVDPVDPSVVFVGHEAGLYRTTNGGDSWVLLAQPGYSAVRVAIDRQDTSIVYAAFPESPFVTPRGLARSNDRGVTWLRIAPGDEPIVDVAVDPSTPGALFAAAEKRVYRSADYGATWSVLGGDLEGPTILNLEVDASGHHLLAATSAGVYEYEMSAVDIAPVPEGGRDLASLLERAVADGAASRAGFVLPVVGVVQGASGLFRTDVTITNERPYAQQVLVAWLPRDGGAMSFFNLTVPGATGGSEYAIPNVMGRLGLTGVGTIVALGIDASGAFDANASIGGSARICAYNWDRNPVCETIEAAGTDALAAHQRAVASGLRLDAAVRTNIGITNLDSRAHRYFVKAVGERNTATLEVIVPPFSLVQGALPSGDYGALTVEVTSDDASAPWLFFATSIDNATAVATTRIGVP